MAVHLGNPEEAVVDSRSKERVRIRSSQVRRPEEPMRRVIPRARIASQILGLVRRTGPLQPDNNTFESKVSCECPARQMALNVQEYAVPAI